MLVHSFQKYYLFLYKNMLKRANVNVCPEICKMIPEIWGRGSRADLPILECAALPCKWESFEKLPAISDNPISR